MLGEGGVEVGGVVLLQLSQALLPEEEELAMCSSLPLPRRGLGLVADALPRENMVHLLAIVGPGSLVDPVLLDYHPRVKEGVMSDEDQA